jgi:hypothetical protein
VGPPRPARRGPPSHRGRHRQRLRSRRRPPPPAGPGTGRRASDEPEATPSRGAFAADEQHIGHPVTTPCAGSLAEAVLADEGVRGRDRGVDPLRRRDAIADLNKRFLGKDGPTDVLAFPIDEEPSESGRSPTRGAPGPATPARSPDRSADACSATWSSARPSLTATPPSTPGPTRTNWPCWSCTGSCICSDGPRGRRRGRGHGGQGTRACWPVPHLRGRSPDEDPPVGGPGPVRHQGP